jgi:hypothetical protein
MLFRSFAGYIKVRARTTSPGEAMPSYEELKSELEVIAKTVEKFPEAVKPRVFELLVQTFLGQSPAATPVASLPPTAPPAPSGGGHTRRAPAKRKKSNAQAAGGEQSNESATEQKKTSRRANSGKESYQIDRQLNLRGDKSIPAFTTFVEEKKPDTTQEFNAVVVYYLQKMLGLPSVTLNQAYTCFTEAKRRPPDAFRQSFTDTKNRKGWVEFDAEGNLRAPHRGVVFVEHDLPKAPKPKA